MDTPVRVATVNLCSGRLADGRPGDNEQLVACGRQLAAEGVDVVAVQEVDRGQPRSGEIDQLAVLAAAFGAVAHRFAPTVLGTPGTADGWREAPGATRTHGSHGLDSGDTQGPAYGIGMLSRLPVHVWRVRRLGGSWAVLPLVLPRPGHRPQLLLVPDEPRLALAAVVATDAGPVSVVCTHLSFAPWVAPRQLRALVRWTASLPEPRVLAGDLNLPGAVPARLTGWHPLALAPTFPAAAPRLQLDHLLVDTEAAATHLPGRATRQVVSDHLTLVADMVVPNRTAQRPSSGGRLTS